MFSVFYLVVSHFAHEIGRGRVMEETYTASREAVDRAKILGQGQAGEERGGC